jgi:hypothetical protein
MIYRYGNRYNIISSGRTGMAEIVDVKKWVSIKSAIIIKHHNSVWFDINGKLYSLANLLLTTDNLFEEP